MKEKKIPLRTCVITKEKFPKKELLRIVKSKEGDISVDLTGKKNGRGAYICKDEECLKKLQKSKRLDRVFEMVVPEEIYENIRGVVVDK